MENEVDDDVYFFAIHPCGMQRATLSQLQQIPLHAHFLFPPIEANFVVDPYDLDNDSLKHTHTRFRFGRHIRREDYTKVFTILICNGLLVDEFQVSIYEDKTYRRKNAHKDPLAVLERFVPTVAFVNEMERAACVVSTIKGYHYESDKLQISLTLRSLEREKVWKEELAKLEEQGNVIKWLKQMGQLDSREGWIINDPINFKSSNHTFRLTINFNYERICAGVVLYGEEDVHPTMPIRGLCGSIPVSLGFIAQLKDGASILDISDGMGEMISTSLFRNDCTCYWIGTNERHAHYVEANWNLSKKYYDCMTPKRKKPIIMRGDLKTVLDFPFNSIDVIVCIVPLRFMYSMNYDVICGYYEDLFNIVEKSKKKTILVVPHDHMDIIQSAASQEDPEYTFTLTLQQQVTSFTETVTMVCLQPAEHSDPFEYSSFAADLPVSLINPPYDGSKTSNPSSDLLTNFINKNQFIPM